MFVQRPISLMRAWAITTTATVCRRPMAIVHIISFDATFTDDLSNKRHLDRALAPRVYVFISPENAPDSYMRRFDAPHKTPRCALADRLLPDALEKNSGRIVVGD